MHPIRIFLAALMDGLMSPPSLFIKVERPGSGSAELDELTTPEMLAAYEQVDASLPGMLLDFKWKEHRRDVAYVTTLRMSGIICLLATISALCFLILRSWLP